MRVVVVGAGVMGLSAARVLAARDHQVVLVDRYGVGNKMSSSSGATRIWRLAHPDRERVRLSQWNVELWDELQARGGRPLLMELGLLWRGGDATNVAKALAAEGVDHALVGEEEQGVLFPELRWQPDRPVVWQPQAGALLAADALAVSADLFVADGGEPQFGDWVRSVDPRPGGGVRVRTDRHTLDADVAVVAPGPWAQQFLARLGVDVPLKPVLEQVTYVRGGDLPWQSRPSLIDVPDEGGSFGLYGLPTPGLGYKVGIDVPLCDLDLSSDRREPDPQRERDTVERVRQDLPGLDSTVVRSEVCSWTSSSDDLFILDRVGDIVVGCADGGQGFKFLPLIGEVLADLVEDRPARSDTEIFRLRRFQ